MLCPYIISGISVEEENKILDEKLHSFKIE